jgi:hypothetical protein
MLPKLKQFFETIFVTEIHTGHLKNNWTRTSLRMLTLTNFDETIEEKKEDIDDSL